MDLKVGRTLDWEGNWTERGEEGDGTEKDKDTEEISERIIYQI